MVEDLLLTNAQVIDPDRDGSNRRDVFISAGRVTEKPGRTANGHVTIDLSGLFVIPGLIDMHVHMSHDPHGTTGISNGADIPTATRATLAKANLGRALDVGVTTVRDLGTPSPLAFEIKDAWHSGSIEGARPFTAAQPITSVGGHCAWFGLEAADTAAASAAVESNIAAGADVTKLMTRSAARPSELTREQLAAAVQASHARGIPVAVHANFWQDSIDNAVAAGCDSIEHGYALTAATAGEMVRRGTALSPTLSALNGLITDPATWRTRGGNHLADLIESRLPAARASIARAAQAGVTFIAGTDAGVTGVGFDSLPTELELMVSWGVPPREALRSATTNAGRVLRRPGLGNLGFNSHADLVVLTADPREDLSALQEPVMVVQDGQVVRDHR